MPSPRDVLALIERIRCIYSEEERQQLLSALGAVERPTILSFINAHGINLCTVSEPALAAFHASDVLLRDGIAMQLAMPALGIQPGFNMNGTDFIPLLLRRLPARRVSIYGTELPWLERARDRLQGCTPHSYIDLQHGFHSREHYVEQARRTRPDIILLAMGMPRQEELAVELKRTLDHKVLIINGGAIVDFLAERFARAPVLVQKVGLEWAFRFAQEPRRLFRRYFVGAFGFTRNVMLLRRSATSRTSSAPAPAPMHKEL